MRALVVEHDHASPTGSLGRRLTERGYELVHHLVVPVEHYAHPDVTTAFPDFTDFDLVVLLGAPWAVYDVDLIGRWLRPEQEQIRAAVAAGVPILGVCFGGQLLADTFGGSVARSPAPELGWVEVASDAPHIVPGGQWFQWHFDRWELPPDAVELARNDAASQAFRLGRNLALQFHPELDAACLRGWIDNEGRDTVLSMGHDPEELVAATRADEPRAAVQTAALVDGFLDHVAGA